MTPEPILIVAGCLLSAALGSGVTWWRIGRRGRSDYRRGVRDTEKLIRDRVLQDHRDNIRLF